MYRHSQMVRQGVVDPTVQVSTVLPEAPLVTIVAQNSRVILFQIEANSKFDDIRRHFR